MLTRRQFIVNSGAIGASLMASPMAIRDNLSSKASGYRALVCINLAGGNDSFNMLVPSDTVQYAAYSNARGNLALDRSDLIDLSGQAETGSCFSVHSGMPELQELYDKGEAAFVANVGALNKPLSRAELKSNIDFGPAQLLSHTGQISKWQTGSSQLITSSGWGGRTADLLQSIFPTGDIPISQSMSGANTFQLGKKTFPYDCEPPKVHSLISKRSVGIDFDFVTSQLAKEAYRNLHGASLNWPETAITIDTKNGVGAYDERDKSLDLQAKFAQDHFSQQLSKVAQIISEQDPTKPARQIFYVSFSGWDHHHQLLSNQATMLPVLSQGLLSFRNALSELGMFEHVTTFTASEFGRSLTSNGSGSDHGWGGHQIVMGGGIQGAQVYGHYPELSSLNPLNIGQGVYAPTTSNDQYFAELVLWLGVPISKIGYVLPNLQAFNSRLNNGANLGFLSNS
tara:strand:+ start:1335 stop:2696 length:1362 start_codon:yes stop_codon:yes gene_type:complete